jgi:hypothetical protein
MRGAGGRPRQSVDVGWRSAAAINFCVNSAICEWSISARTTAASLIADQSAGGTGAVAQPAQSGMTDAARALTESAARARFFEAIYPLRGTDRHVVGLLEAVHAAGLKIVEGTKP